MWDREDSKGEETLPTNSTRSSYSQPLLARLSTSSIEAQHLLWQFGGSSIASSDEVARKGTPTAVKELSELGLLVPLTDPDEILAFLPLYRLREIQKRHGLRGGRSRADVATLLSGKLDQQAIREEVKDVALVRIGSPQLRDLMPSQTEWAKLMVLAHTLSFEILRETHWESYRSGEVKRVEVIGTGDRTDCQECEKQNGKKIRLTAITDLPPFHPGCRCSTVGCLD
jgi:SPP1 gp7 family putative phage head morphogenesis protein